MDNGFLGDLKAPATPKFQHSKARHVYVVGVRTWGARSATAAALPLAAVMIFWGRPIMAAVFGAGFARGAIALAILSAAQLINAFTGPANSLLDMTGHQDDILKAMAVGVFTNVALNALLIPRWDIAGAAVATGTSLIVWNLLLVVFVQRRLGLDATTFGSKRILMGQGKL